MERCNVALVYTELSSYVVPAATEIGQCYVALVDTEIWLFM
jgi:hypothetical protein